MKRVQKIAVVGASMSAIALVSGALGVAVAGATSHRAYRAVMTTGTAAGLPNTTIKGKPVHWSPSRVSVKARWTTPPTCSASQASFTISNRKSKAETITWSGTNGFTPGAGVIAAKSRAYDCISKGYDGTLTVKLSDGKKLKVTV